MKQYSTIKNRQLIITLLLFLNDGFSLHSKSSSSDYMIGIEYLNEAYNQWKQSKFFDALQKFNQINDHENSGLKEYWIGTSYFFLAIHDLFSTDKKIEKKQGRKNIKQGIKALNKAIHLNPEFSENYALRGVLRGILIKLKPMSVFKQGPFVGKDRKKALLLDENNPRVHYLTGVSFWYAPEILGGKDQALEHFLKAEKKFEQEFLENKDPKLPKWGYSQCLSFTGHVYFDLNDHLKAKNYYKKALSINPKDRLAKKGLTKLNEKKKE